MPSSDQLKLATHYIFGSWLMLRVSTLLDYTYYISAAEIYPGGVNGWVAG